MNERKDKPLSEWTLGEAQAECNSHDGCSECVFCRPDDHTLCRLYDGYDGIGGQIPGWWDLRDFIPPSLTLAELAICKAIPGVKYVSLGTDAKYVTLWSEKPERDEEGECVTCLKNDAAFIGILDLIIFPSVRRGDLICVEEADDEAQA